jgi:hypothetical protein
MAGRQKHLQLEEKHIKRSIEVGKGWQGDRSTGSWQRSIHVMSTIARRLEMAGRET